MSEICHMFDVHNNDKSLDRTVIPTSEIHNLSNNKDYFRLFNLTTRVRGWYASAEGVRLDLDPRVSVGTNLVNTKVERRKTVRACVRACVRASRKNFRTVDFWKVAFSEFACHVSGSIGKIRLKF